MSSESLKVMQSRQQALANRYAKALLKTDRGIGDKSLALAQEFADSGLSPAIATMVMRAVYAPADREGRGQGTRFKWFMETVRRRYSDRLEKARDHIPYLRTILAEMEEIAIFRDALNGEGASISFEDTFNLFELGYDAESILGIISDMDCPRGLAIWKVLQAVRLVKSGRAQSLESALEFQ